tara:strand:- start:3522 stop:4229 length:708 start_codon:yes stop_codon:yes gene_type:complete
VNKGNLCVIPARGGSKGIKNKNLKKIEGKSLLEISINEALKSKIFDTIHVSTESLNIKKEAQKFGIDFPFMRNKKLSKDSVHVAEVVYETILNFKKKNISFENVCLLMPTSPLRTNMHIKNAYKIFKKTDADSLVSLSPLGKLETNLRTFKDKNYIKYYKDNIKRNQNRQNTKELFSVNGSIYFSKISSFLKNKSFHIDKVIGYKMSSIHSIDVNSEEDLEIAKLLFKFSRSGNF